MWTSFFQIPVKQAIHLLDILDYFFSGVTPISYQWGHRFGGDWWELSENQMPDINAILIYANELEIKIIQHLSSLEDGNVSEPSPIAFKWAKTRMGYPDISGSGVGKFR